MIRLSICLLFFLAVFQAKAISNISINVAELSAGMTTEYEFEFTTDRDMFSGDVIVLQTNTSAGPNFSAAFLVQMVPAMGSITNTTATSVNVTLNNTLLADDVIYFNLGNITNPGDAGQGPDYTIRTVVFNPGPVIIEVNDIPGSNYTPSNIPTVSVQIPDQVIFEGDGPEVVITDLNDHFTDGDMDDLTFTDGNTHDVSLLSVQVSGDELSLEGLGSGTTTVNIEASDLPSGTGEGVVDDEFDVRVIGELNNAYVQLLDDQGGATTTYTFGFDAVNTIDNNHLIIISTDVNGSDFSLSTLNSLTGGSLSGSVFSQTSELISIQIDGGSVAENDSVQLILSQVTNPSITGEGPAYNIRIFDLSNTYDQDKAMVAGIFFDVLVGSPVVTNPFNDANLDEVDGSVVWVDDLNNNFADTDGDVLTFTVEPGYNTDIVDVSINGSELTLTPLMYGSTGVEIKASDLPSATGEGEVLQAFTVDVYGELKSLTVTPSDFEINNSTSYQVSFDADVVFESGDLLGFQTFTGGPDFTDATLSGVSSGNINLSVLAISANEIAFNTSNSQVKPGNNISFTLDNVINPPDHGMGANYEIVHIKFPEGIIASGMAQGNQFINSDVIFTDNFESQNIFVNSTIKGKVEVLNQQYEMLVPVND